MRDRWRWLAAGVVPLVAVLLGAVLLGRKGGEPAVASGLPGPVLVLRAGPGGHSGEIQLDWGAVKDVTTYRILVESPTKESGPYVYPEPYTDLAVLSLEHGAAADMPGMDPVAAIWSDSASYFPGPTHVDSTAPPTEFHLLMRPVDPAVTHLFRVVGGNAVGEGPPSNIVCGYQAGSPWC